jgi:hypothetical protein
MKKSVRILIAALALLGAASLQSQALATPPFPTCGPGSCVIVPE